MFGLGLRPAHYETIIQTKPAIDFFECITEDFIHFSGDDFWWLEKIRAHYPVSLHGVSLSIGSVDPLNKKYLQDLKKLISYVQPLFVSDHLCWTGVDGINTHDLLPLPYTEEVILHIVSRIQYIQDFLGRQIMLENISTYAAVSFSEMREWEFITEIAQRADCFILLDINNIYVNAFNHDFLAREYLKAIPADRVKQFHLSGHKHCQTHIIDTHDASVTDAVWDLYFLARAHFPNTPLVIERDADIPPLAELLAELERSRARKQVIPIFAPKEDVD